MHSSAPILPSTNQHQSAKLNSASSTNTGFAFLSTPPKPKHKPQPITTRCSPQRSAPPRAISRRRSSLVGSPVFQASVVVPVSTPVSETPKTPHLTSYGYAAAFAAFPRRGSVSHVQEVPIHQARRAPVSPRRLSPRSAPSSPKRGHSSGSPKRRHHRSPSSPFAPPSPTRRRARAESTTRVPPPVQPTLPLPPTPKLSKIRSLTNLRSRSSSSAPAPRATAPRPTMATPIPITPKVTSKRAKRSATPARGSAAYAKYRPMPFIQQMQMIQFLEGGSLDSHIRRHHVHAGQGTAYTGFATEGKEDVAHGYAFTDERGMVWFDEEEEWEFTCLLPKTRPQRRRGGGFKRLLGKRRDEESSDEWEEFVQDIEEDVEETDPEVILAQEDDVLRAREDDLASFGGALEGTWARAHSGQSVLKLPEAKTHRKRRGRKTARGIVSSAPTLPSAQAPETTRTPRERIAALRKEYLTTAFTPYLTRSSESPSQRPREASPFRMFTRAATSTDDKTSRPFFQRHKNASTGGQSFASIGTSMRGGEVLDATETVSVPQSPTVQWAIREGEIMPRGSNVAFAAETLHRTPSPPHPPQSRLHSVSPPPAAARRLGIEPSTAVSLHPLANSPKKQKLKGVMGFKSAKGN